MDSDDITIIFAVYFIVFFALMYGVVSGFVSDIQHEIDSGIHTEIRGLAFMQGAAIWVYAFAIIVTFFVFLYMFTH